MAASKPGVLQAPLDDDVAGRLGDGRAAAPAASAARASTTAGVSSISTSPGRQCPRPPRGRCDHGGDRFAHEAHHIGRQHRLADRHIIELVQRRWIGLTAARSAAVITVAPSGRIDPHDAPGRHCAAHEAQPAWPPGRSPVKRPSPATRAGSSTRRIARPTHRARCSCIVTLASSGRTAAVHCCDASH